MMNLEALLDKVDLVRLAEEAGARLGQHGKKRCACPLHGGDNKTAFHVYTDHDGRQRWYCFTRCGGGDAIDFVMAWKALPFLDAVRELAQREGLALEDLGWTPEQTQALAQRKLCERLLDQAARYYADRLWSEEGDKALDYARRRGFTDETLKLAGWGFSRGDHGLSEHLQSIGTGAALARDIQLLRRDGTDFVANARGMQASPAGWLIYPHRRGGRVVYLSARALDPKKPSDKARNLPGERQIYRAEVSGRRELVLVEGQADAESLCQLGFSTWALCGLGALPDQEQHELRRRDIVYLALDADTAGAERLDRLARQIGPLVRVIPALPDGCKDFNEWLQNGATPDAVGELLDGSSEYLERFIADLKGRPVGESTAQLADLAALFDKLPQPAQARYLGRAAKALGINKTDLKRQLARYGQFDGSGLSEIRDGQLWFGDELLGNFTAEIIHELYLDDGLNLPKVRYTIRGQLATGETLEPVDVPAVDFESFRWIAEHWGARPIRYISPARSYILGRTIQETSEPTREHVYTHTGWGTIGGKRCYLSASGAISEDGLDESVRVDLGQNNLRYYRLPPPPEGPRLAKAVRASLDFLDLGPSKVTAPLWSAMFAAPLTEVCPLNAVIWIYGGTGTRKSTIACLALSHFGGGFVHGHNFYPPVDWRSTQNSLEESLFRTKDIPIVVDDFKPELASARKAAELHDKGQWVVRGVGNRSGRGRLRSDLSQHPDRPPRGLVIATGENPLAGESTVARMLYVPMAMHDLPVGDEGGGRLDEAQRLGHEGLYAKAMSGFLRWLSRNWSRLCEDLPRRVQRESDRARERLSAGTNPRLADDYAVLAVAAELAIEAFADLGVMPSMEAIQYHDEMIKGALLDLVIEQQEKVLAESPVQRFFLALDSLLRRLKVYLEPRLSRLSFEPPRDAESIGWFDPDDPGAVWLDTADCLRKVKSYWRELDIHYDIMPDMLRRHLAQAGVLRKRDPTHFEISKWIQGKTRRVLEVDVQTVSDLYGIELRNEDRIGQ